MMPPKTDQRWLKLVDGSLQHKFSCVPAGLMISRVRRELQADGSPASRDRSVQEVYSFFQRYESILTDDIKAVFGQEV